MLKKLTQLSSFFVLASMLAMFGSFCFGSSVSIASTGEEVDMVMAHSNHDSSDLSSSNVLNNQTRQADEMPCCYENKSFPIENSIKNIRLDMEYKKAVNTSASITMVDSLKSSLSSISIYFNGQEASPPEVALASIFKKE